METVNKKTKFRSFKNCIHFFVLTDTCTFLSSHDKSHQNAFYEHCYLDKKLLVSSSGNSRKVGKINMSLQNLFV